jgi:hypothetical protein
MRAKLNELLKNAVEPGQLAAEAQQAATPKKAKKQAK